MSRHSHLDDDPANVDQVQLPADRLNSYRDSICINYHSDVEEQEVGAGSFGSGAVLEAFYGVECLQGCPTPGTAPCQPMRTISGI